MGSDFPIYESYLCPFGVRGDSTYCYNGIPFIAYTIPVTSKSRLCKAWDDGCKLCTLCD